MDYPVDRPQIRRRIIGIKFVIAAIPAIAAVFLANAHRPFIPVVKVTYHIAPRMARVVVKKNRPTFVRAHTTISRAAMSQPMVVNVGRYRPSSDFITINQTLRGSHQLVVYAAHELIQVSFDKVDLNRYSGLDILRAQANCTGSNLSTNNWYVVTVGDDGNTGSHQPQGRPQRIRFSFPVYRPSVCTISIVTSGDVLLKNLTSRQHLLAFQHRVYLAEGPAYTKVPFTPINLTTDSVELVLSADHNPGKQTVAVDDTMYGLNRVRENHVVSGLVGQTTFCVSKGDIVISGDGMIAISPAMLIPTK